MLYVRCSVSNFVALLLLWPKIANGQIKDRSIPVEHSCNRLPYILKDTDLRFSYSADHLADRNCIISVSGQDKVCVNFAEYYLDCETDIILVDSGKLNNKQTYSCDSRHSDDFCSTKSTLEIIFQRKKNLHKDGFGFVELKIYATRKPSGISGTAVTVIIVIGGIFGVLCLLVVSSVLLSRALYNLHYKSSLERAQNCEEYSLRIEGPTEPPPPYPGSELEQETLRVQ